MKSPLSDLARRAVVGAHLVVSLLLAGCGGSSSPTAPSQPSSPGGGGSGGAGGPSITPPEVLVGAGDIAVCGEPGAERTARLLDAIPGTVMALGDLAYHDGSDQNFRDCYGPTWGRHRGRTWPVPGNHEYHSANATPYFNYFEGRAGSPGRGYYSYRLGAWLVLAIDSVVPVNAGSAQYEWVRSELASSPKCTVAYMHHPLFAPGPNGDTPRMRPLWDLFYQAGVDVVVAGHDHLYERQGRQDPAGRFDPVRGIRAFVVGTGGGPLYQIVRPSPNSEARHSGWGVLKLSLAAEGYGWEFVPVAGDSFTDVGTDACH